MKHILVFSVLVILFVTCARADRPGDFRVIGPGGGGAMFNPTISPHDTNTVLISCDMTGSYITHDGGNSWRMFNLRGVVNFFVFDPVDASGQLVAGTKLLWPQTEYLKACVAQAEWLDNVPTRAVIPAHLKLIAERFMREDGANWHNQLARDGTPIAPMTPARVLYHLFLAVAEAERVLAKTS